jgi:hypothetical protein
MKAPSRLSLASRARFWLTVGLIGVGAGCERALAQSLAAAGVPPADESATVARPGPIPQPDDPTPMPGAAGAGDPSAGQDFPDDLLTPDPEATHESGLLDLIRESMFAKRDDLWRPLPLRTFFSEGWNEPWSASPRSSTGAPRQAWINAFDGVFYHPGRPRCDVLVSQFDPGPALPRAKQLLFLRRRRGARDRTQDRELRLRADVLDHQVLVTGRTRPAR